MILAMYNVFLLFNLTMTAYHFPISSSSVTRRRYTIQHTINHASLVFFTFCFTVYHIIFTILSNHLDVTITFSPLIKLKDFSFILCLLWESPGTTATSLVSLHLQHIPFSSTQISEIEAERALLQSLCVTWGYIR